MAEKEKKPAERVKYQGVFDIVSIVASAIVAVAIAFLFVFRTVGISGRSMVPTLQNGNRIILSACSYGVEPGDIVVTCQPSKVPEIPTVLVKRLIATEGQTVDIDFTKHIVYVDGVPLDEPYINEPTAENEGFSGPVTVPEGYVFVMGDNRNHSTDSRSYMVGFIREEYIMGKALFRIAPFGEFKIENNGW